jgi:hypothetical protein
MPKGYTIDFACGGSQRITGKGMSSKGGASDASSIYSKLILAIKKLIEQENPDLLSFYGAEDSMDVMYDIFVRRFLGDGPGKDPHLVFFPVDGDNYISKAWIEGVPEERRQEIYGLIKDAKSEKQNYLGNVKKTKVIKRKIDNLNSKLNNLLVGKFIVAEASPNRTLNWESLHPRPPAPLWLVTDVEMQIFGWNMKVAISAVPVDTEGMLSTMKDDLRVPMHIPMDEEDVDRLVGGAGIWSHGYPLNERGLKRLYDLNDLVKTEYKNKIIEFAKAILTRSSKAARNMGIGANVADGLKQLASNNTPLSALEIASAMR